MIESIWRERERERERVYSFSWLKITYLEKERAKLFIAQFGTFLDVPTVMSLDRLQLGEWRDTLTMCQ